MLELSGFNFLLPSPLVKELLILTTIQKYPNISQRKISKEVSLVPSMVNKYINDLKLKNYIEVVGENNKHTQYLLTENGLKRLKILTLSFISEISILYSQTQDIFSNVSKILKDKKIEKLFLYGAGEVGEIFLNVLDVEVIGFIDDDVKKQGKYFNGYKIYSPLQAIKMNYDCVVVASFKNSNSILENAKKVNLNNIFLFTITDKGKVTLKGGDL
jgi:FlaA1/EpsC-like NDP-sugar epimerase